MSLSENQSQSDARDARAAFLSGSQPSAPTPAASALRESQAQAGRRDFLKAFFATTKLAESSSKKPRSTPALRPKVEPPQSSKTVNQALGKAGKILFQDDDGAELGRLEWDRRKILTEGTQIIRICCEDSSSYPV